MFGFAWITCVQVPVEARSPGTGGIGSCKLLSVYTGNQTWAIYKSNKRS